MSSNEDEGESSSQIQGAKKRRIQRACDTCRRKKIRCDGGQMPGNRCSNCIAYSFECTYVEAARKRGPPKGYVEALENRIEKLQKLLSRLYPDGDINKDLDHLLELDEHQASNDSMSPPPSHTSPDPIPFASARTPVEVTASAIRSLGDPPVTQIPDDDDDLGHVILEKDLRGLSIDEQMKHRFFGKSSGAMLLQAALDMKREVSGQPKQVGFNDVHLPHKRDQFWSSQSWEPFTASNAPHEPEYDFPEPDLLSVLIDNYFKYYNLLFPLLHRPTFEKAVQSGLHQSNDTFAAVLLLVCANGARYSDDPRVLLDDKDELSVGWKWFKQVQMVRKSLLSPPTLYDLQFYCLTVQFLQGSSAPHACWIMVGIGVRLAQDVGAHRRKAQSHKLSVEDELWKRAFWVLVSMDRITSTVLGRPCAIQDEDFDLDLPIEVDDEYWEHPDPDQAFKQPPGKPSTTTFFTCFLRLNQVLGIALRTIYSINKSKILLGFVGPQWEQHIVAELDSALNKWVDSVPDHLRWDPNREHIAFFNQSATLYSNYYQLQILIHRPFIRRPSPLSFPSMAICTNAARTCSHIVDILRHRFPGPLPQVMNPAFTAGIVLLLNIWAGKRSGLATDPQKEMADVHKCMKVLSVSEQRFLTAGRLWDVLFELANLSDLPLPVPSPANKRDRDEDEHSSPPASTSMSSPSSDTPRYVAGSRRVSAKESMHASSSSIPAPNNQQFQHYTSFLPTHSEELGRLPLHGQVDFSGMRPPVILDPDPNPPNPYWYPPMSSGQATAVSSVGSDEALMNDQVLYDQLLTAMRTPYGQQFQPMMTGGMEMPTIPSGTIDGLQPQVASAAAANPASIPSQGAVPFDNDTMAMWINAPSGFELDDWGQYLSNVSELTHGVNYPGPSNQ